MKHLDGSMLEGGGQIIRNAVALSAILKTPVDVFKIRAGRQNPGLSPQHLCGLELVTEMSKGKCEGGVARSTHITFVPQDITCGTYTADTKTAESCTLMMQQALPCLLFAHPSQPTSQEEPSHQGRCRRAPDTSILHLRGGTDASMAPPIAYLTDVLGPLLHHLFNINVQIKLIRRGFFPKGGGIIEACIQCLGSGEALTAFNLTDRGQLTSIHVKAYAAGRLATQDASEVMATTATKELHRLLGAAGAPCGPIPPITQEATRESKETAFGEGGGCIATAATSTGCLLGAARPLERGTPPEATAVLVAGELAAAIDSGACVDAQMQDQLVIFMALAQGTSRLRCSPLTLHTQTAMAVAQQLTGCKFRVATHHGGPAGSLSEQWLLECDGIGHSRQ